MTGDATKSYDICIIGAGPAGLAALSSIQEDYNINMLSHEQINRATKWLQKNSQSHAKRICVIDANDQWLHQWEQNFTTLDISFLRSPAVAHCSYFDRNALLAYAVSEGREDELLDSGCSSIKSLGGTSMTHNGLWKLPSTKLFIDFSRSYAKSLSHDFVQGKVVDLCKNENSTFNIEVNGKSDTCISCKSVILATGAIGRPVVPKSLASTESPRIVQWKYLDKILPMLDRKLKHKGKRVLVVGGGLTAVQTAHKVVRSGYKGTSTKVVLCSRRPLVERHFDIPVKWFDEREALYHQSEFYHEPAEERLEALKGTRGGGTVPPIYMDTTREMEEHGELSRFIGDIKIIQENDDKSLVVRLQNNNNEDFEDETFDAIILACGLQPDCLSNPLIRNIQEQWPVEIAGGFPSINADLRWTDNLYVIGGLASLSVGPDAANLMGISRAAETVSKNLDSKRYLRREDSNVLKNPFEAFMDDSDSSSDEEEED